MNRKAFLVVTILSWAFITAKAQERTIGLIRNEEGSFQGYTLFAPIMYTTTYLINNEGLLVHSWESIYAPGLSVYLSTDGYLYRTIVTGASARFENLGGGVEKLDWEGNVLWHYEYDGSEHTQHHDIEVMPNGNVLMLVWEHKDFTESVAAGRDPNALNADGLWSEGVIEVEPVGDSGGNIVWEWHVWDHLVQDFDPTKDNYGVVRDNPGLINLNYAERPESPDWIHLNSVRYNEKLDQIILSCREFGEVWVIDRSTSSEEARGHSAGKYGKGGDILYRWGNPRTYDRGDRSDQQLSYQHDAQWIDSGLLGAGDILILNNGLSVVEIVPPIDEQGNYSIGGLPYLPEEPLWTYPLDDTLNSYIFSGAQRLPNSNTLICYGLAGTFVEITPEGDEVWCYVNPVTCWGPGYQGDTIPVPGANLVFKIRRYAPDYPGLAGKDLTPDGPIEKYRDAVEENPSVTQAALELYPNPFSRSAIVVYQLGMSGHVSIKLYNALGQELRTLLDEVKPAGSHQVIWDATDNLGRRLSPGVYFCTLQSDDQSVTRRIVLIQ